MFSQADENKLRFMDAIIHGLLGWEIQRNYEYYVMTGLDLVKINGVRWKKSNDWDGSHYATEKEALESVPHYTTDMNLAIKLVKGNDRFALYGKYDGRWGVESGFITSGYESATVFFDDNPALAICKAWLALQGSEYRF